MPHSHQLILGAEPILKQTVDQSDEEKGCATSENG